MVLLHQVNPVEPYDTVENLNAQLHHAHQVCGIVAHTKDRGVASVAIRSLAIAAAVLRDPREQDEVFALLRKITAETGWRIGQIYSELQHVWGRDMKDVLGTLAAAPSWSPRNVQLSGELPPAYMHGSGYGPGAASGPGDSLSSLPPPLKGSAVFMGPAVSPGRRPLPVSGSSSIADSRARHLRMHSTVSVASITSAPGASSSAHSSPSISAPTPHRPPMMNPLMHADFSLPDHPYKAFYRPPNDSTHFN